MTEAAELIARLRCLSKLRVDIVEASTLREAAARLENLEARVATARADAFEECASHLRKYQQSRLGHEWVPDILWDNIFKRVADQIDAAREASR